MAKAASAMHNSPVSLVFGCLTWWPLTWWPLGLVAACDSIAPCVTVYLSQLAVVQSS